jgi:hypothetical protein
MHLLFPLFLIRSILPQTSCDNRIVERINRTKFFANYFKAKMMVLFRTWRFLLIFTTSYLVL